MKNKIILGILLLFAVMQLFRIEKVENQEPTEMGLLLSENQSVEITNLLQETCFGCHSNQIIYPWYSEIAPVSWWIADHIEHGRKHLNFSEWMNYSTKTRVHKAEESWEEIEEKEMPLESYAFAHEEADLNAEERQILVDFFKSLQQKYSTQK